MSAAFSRCPVMFLRLLLASILLLGLLLGEATPAAAAPAPGTLAQTAGPEAAVGTGFTYQGELKQGEEAYTGACDFQFRLFDAASGDNQVAPTPPNALAVGNVALANGRFTVRLDFGAGAFNGAERWLEIGVRCPAGTGSYTTLGRQELTAAPYASYAGAVPWSGVSGAPLQLPGNCASGQVGKWGGAAWACAADDNTTYTAGSGLALNGTQFSVNTAAIQARVSGACAVGSTVQAVNADGTVVCSRDAIFSRAAPAANQITTLDMDHAGWYPSITIGADGLPVIGYFDWSGNLNVVRCNDAACKTGSLSTVDSTGGTSGHTSIAIGDDGLPIISYYDKNNGDLKVAHCNDVACTTATSSKLDGTGTNVGQYTSIAIGTDGLPIISYYDVGNGDLKVAHCNDAACTTANALTLGGATTNVGRYTAIAIGADGLPIISYMDATNYDLNVAHCYNVACTTLVITKPDTSGLVQGFSAMAIGADGLPIISYYVGGGDLQVAHCDDVACTTAAKTKLDGTTGTDVGYYTSIAIGADGLPIISYYDDTNGAFKAAHCGNVTCTAATALTLDVTGITDVVQFTSITIGTDGLPIIAYYDGIHYYLKVVHCGSALCVPHLRPR